MSDLDNDESEQVHVEQLIEIPPVDDITSGCITWERPIGLITWGLLLTSVHINHLYLQYILPTVGVLLFYYGTSSLRCENKWFRATLIFAITKSARSRTWPT